MNSNRFKILLVEDNAADAELTQEAWSETATLKEITVVPNGEEAMNYLMKRGKYASLAPPDLILLDLNLPRKNGKEVLAEIKLDAELRKIPVIVLTNSMAQKDIQDVYALQASGYIKKGQTFDQCIRMVKGIEEFWFNIATLPRDN